MLVYKVPFGNDLERWCPNTILTQTLEKKKDEVNAVNDYLDVQGGWERLEDLGLLQLQS